MNTLLATMAPWIDFSIPFDLLFYVLTHIKMPERKVSKNEAVVRLSMSHTVVSESQTECPQPATQGRPPHSCYLRSSNCRSPGSTEWPAMTVMERWWSKAAPWSTTQRWNKRTSAQITTPVETVSSSMSNWNTISKSGEKKHSWKRISVTWRLPKVYLERHSTENKTVTDGLWYSIYHLLHFRMLCGDELHKDNVEGI